MEECATGIKKREKEHKMSHQNQGEEERKGEKEKWLEQISSDSAFPFTPSWTVITFPLSLLVWRSWL